MTQHRHHKITEAGPMRTRDILRQPGFAHLPHQRPEGGRAIATG